MSARDAVNIMAAKASAVALVNNVMVRIGMREIVMIELIPFNRENDSFDRLTA